ncbi:endonuclease MutS2 [Macrococcoides caseolyticum]|uniref:endonuclease MutS2 n=1 Tax=Macrococcoides caseolyticum TaxID=69966 RepID=UPI001F35D1F7|nr:endonuclease MutS2 [Macrococcus caseolyticus]MCE4956266.1 endonuclease MutS2 [Macrococcus caseolyticus]
MNKKALNILEYDKIIARVVDFAQNELSTRILQSTHPTSDIKEIHTMMEHLEEARLVEMGQSEPGMSMLSDIDGLVRRAVIGSVLSVIELNKIKNNIKVINRYKTYIFNQYEEREVDIPLIYNQMKNLPTITELAETIQAKCDETSLYDNASPELAQIRQEMNRINRKIKEKLEQIVRSSNNQKKLSDAIVTVRNGRQVIPVRSEYKQDFPGIVHDTSSSGQTFYIEPNSIVQLSTELSSVSHRENEEVERILYELTNEVAAYDNALTYSTMVLADFDVNLAKAKYGNRNKMVMPHISEERTIDLPQAWHPLLPRETVVKNNIVFYPDVHSVIITGPNTGGKTVTLKTVGLIIMMAQSGMMIPAFEGATISVFDEVFCDIGDEQSIEQSLSTFSSHMTNIVSILEHMTERSFVMFDELGAGTDPAEGAALAMSILDRCLNRGVMAMATTHYPELKAYSYNRDHVMNASVEFDVDTLSPTYRLLMGIPGKSNAFDIAKKLGLDLSIIKEARQMINMDNKEIDNMIASLEKNAKQIEDDRVLTESLKLEAQSLHKDLNKAFTTYEKQKEKLIENAKQQANEIVKKAEKEADELLKQLRELKSNADIKENELIEQRSKLSGLYHETKIKENKKSTKDELIVKGDHVKVLSYGQKGVILDVDGEEAVVQMGIIKMKLPLNELEKEKAPKQDKVRVVPRANRQTIKMELDIRGERYEDALYKVEQYLDQAILSNYNQVTIIHGKGTGALQKGVQQFLRKSKAVNSFRGGMPSEGGFGVTVVELK